MRLFYFFISISLSFTACSQENLKVVKMCSSSGDESFIDKNYKSQELFFKGENLIGQINYSYNGWQIYDSISYENKGLNLCVKTFTAQYNVEERLFEKYAFEGVNCDEEINFSNRYLNNVNDKYFLSRPYLKDLDLLLGFHPHKNGDEFNFKEGVIPSILTKYGIPFNEKLNSFSFNITSENNLISNDEFYFSGYIVKRKYEYVNSVLRSVIITIENKKTSVVLKYEEKYIL